MKPPNLADMRDHMAAKRAQMDAQRDAATLRAEGLMMKVHRQIYVRSGGALGEKMLGVSSLLLTVTRRRSGMPQTVALVFATDGEDWIVVGSNGGQDSNPDWLKNLEHNPAVEVQVGKAHTHATAEVVDRNDRRYERLWRLVNTNNHGRYYRYQHSTKRPIPLVILKPAD